MEKRVFLIVLDSCGCGEMPDSADFGDAGSNTLRACTTSSKLNIPMLTKMGIFNIDEVGCGTPVAAPVGAYGRMAEKSRGKDTTIGHWELAGVISPQPMPTFPDGFPESFIKAFEEKTGRKVLCNKALFRDRGDKGLRPGAEGNRRADLLYLGGQCVPNRGQRGRCAGGGALSYLRRGAGNAAGA